MPTPVVISALAVITVLGTKMNRLVEVSQIYSMCGFSVTTDLISTITLMPQKLI